MTKTFDTVDHVDVLYESLQNAGIIRKALLLMKNYLEKPIQKVQLTNALNSPQTVMCGVSQETILGVMLFTIYVNILYINIWENNFVCRVYYNI